MMTKAKRAVLAALMMAGLGMGVVPAAQADMTQDQVQQLLDELKGIRTALEKLGAVQGAGGGAPQQPVSDKVSMAMPDKPHQLGKKDAPVVVVEYTDLQCPFCQQFHNNVYDQLKRNYVDTGKVLFISRDFPLDFHPWARPAAVAARCADQQNKFWEVRNSLMSNADKLSKEMITQTAANIGLDMKKFQACVDSNAFDADINKQIAEGSAAGVSGTPSFIVGRVVDGKLEGVRVVGSMPYDQFESTVKDQLAAAGK
ncbi:MAG: DsbA family protein [Proteobacteria bacterium]|nr:DsbA family protein [Pseudomonadota bacterium]